MTDEQPQQTETDSDIVKEPITAEDEDRVVRSAVERDHDGHFALTNGQEKTLERAAAAETD